MIQLSKGQTALLNAYINQVDTEVSRAIQLLPAISNSDYSSLASNLQSWIDASQTSNNLQGTNDDGSHFYYDGIDQFPIPPR